MAKPGSILKQTVDGWHITAATPNTSDWLCVHGPGKLAPAKLAAAVASYVSDHGLANNVAILLDSNSALTAKFAVSSSVETRDRRAMSYRAEELLPIAAEDFEADFICEGKHVFTIATPIQDTAAIVNSLNERGLHVQTISPTAISALQSYRSKNLSALDYIVWQNGNALEVLRLGKQLTDWRHLPAESESLQRYFASVQLRDNSKLDVGLLDVVPDIRESIEGQPNLELHSDDASLSDYAKSQATLALAGKTKPWCELRKGRLSTGDRNQALQREWQWCQLALAIFLLAVTFFFWMRGRQYERMISEIASRQENAYRQVFPDSKIPTAIVARLKSERAKLSGARGRDAAVEQPLSALSLLYEFLSGIPEELRVQVQQLRVEDGQVYVDLNMRSIGDAGELADALEQRGFSIEPPTTEQFDDKQVSVRINGTLAPANAEVGS